MTAPRCRTISARVTAVQAATWLGLGVGVGVGLGLGLELGVQAATLSDSTRPAIGMCTS